MKTKSFKVVNNELVFDNSTKISFERTLRIPDDGKIYPLPPSFGHFPVCSVDQYEDKVPKEWKKHGGVFIPMYQREAMWIQFTASNNNPKAVKVAVGKVNAISGKPWDQKIKANENDYVVIPTQPWLDGINAGDGHIKQFVAMPLGKGYTVEAQVTGKEEFGGIQLIAFDAKPGKFKVQEVPTRKKNPPSPGKYYPPSSAPMLEMESCLEDDSDCFFDAPPPVMCSAPAPSAAKFTKSLASAPSAARSESLVRKKKSKAKEMGLSAGGKMKQKIYSDPHGADTWDENSFARIFVHIVNSEMFEQITGKKPPATPVDASAYTNFGYPWYDLYDEGVSSVGASDILKNVKTVKEMDQEKYAWPQQDDSTVKISGNQVKTMKKDKDEVRDGDW